MQVFSTQMYNFMFIYVGSRLQSSCPNTQCQPVAFYIDYKTFYSFMPLVFIDILPLYHL